MQSVALAIYEIMTALLIRQSAVNSSKTPALVKTTPEINKYNFQCWLCSGQTIFSCSKPIREQFFNIECCRCGMTNKVKIIPQVNK